MKIFRFVPDVAGYGHPWRSGGRWWPRSVELGEWMDYRSGFPDTGITPQLEGAYRADEHMPLSDFPLLSLQLPLLSTRAAESLAGLGLAERLRPVTINGAPFFAVQPLFTVRGQPEAFVAEASQGIRMHRGEIVHYHTLAFDSAHIPGELFTLGPHEPYSELYVTEAFVERVRTAGLTGLTHPELVYDGGPVAPRYRPPAHAHIDQQSWYAQETWQLFYERGSMLSYFEDELLDAFRQAQQAGHVPG